MKTAGFIIITIMVNLHHDTRMYTFWYRQKMRT